MAAISYTALIVILCLTVVSSAPLYKPLRSAKTSSPDQKLLRGAEVSKATSGAGNAPFAPKGIRYYNGPIYSSGLNVYLIWYGKWTKPAQGLIRNFINAHSSNSIASQSVRAHWNLNTLYYNASGKYISPAVNLVQEIEDPYSVGKVFPDEASVRKLVTTAIEAKKFPMNANGMYLVLSSKDVNVVGFCKYFCALNDYTKDPNPSKKIRWAWVGDATDRCLYDCTEMEAPSGDIGLDGVAGTVGYLMSTVLTNPEFNGWQDSQMASPAAKCSFQYGKTMGPKGKKYNMVAPNGVKYLVEQLWNPILGACQNEYIGTRPKERI